MVCIEPESRAWEVFDVATGETRTVSADLAAVARRLVRGLDGAEARAAIAALGSDWVEERDEPFDRVVAARLRALDEELAWACPPGGAWLVRLCETAHSLLRHLQFGLDQLPVLPETAARRALALRELAGPGGEVALVGDDDLIGIAAAAVGLRPTVLELDADIAALSRLVARRLGLDLSVVELDLRQPLPSELWGRFDAFCTDPETSRECITLFVSRGLAALRPGGSAMVACSEDWRPLLEEVASLACMTRRGVMARASSYRNARLELSPYRSDIHLFSAGSSSKPIVPPSEPYEEDLFPLGLFGGEHLIATAEGCDAEALAGPTLARLAEGMVSGPGGSPVTLREARPIPVRVVVAEGAGGRLQATVRGDGTSVEIDLEPAPETAAAGVAAARAIKEALAPGALRLRTLKRME